MSLTSSPISMSGQSPNQNPEQESKTIYCMHCGTAGSVDDYACDLCGERVYVPDPSRVPPLGFTSCQNCASVNEAHASYCAVCSTEIDQSARISPDGADSHRNEGESRFGLGRERRDDPPSRERERGTGYRIGSGTFKPSEWGFPRRSRPSRDNREQTPQEIQRWNWSAFILGPIWGMVHGIWWSILGFLPLLPISPLLRSIGFIVLIGVMLILGLKGNEMAWRARQWDSAEKFLAVQQRWATWSFIFAIGAFVAFIFFLLGQG